MPGSHREAAGLMFACASGALTFALATRAGMELFPT